MSSAIKAILKKSVKDKKNEMKAESHDYEYDLTNQEGKTFKIKVHREIKKPLIKN